MQDACPRRFAIFNLQFPLYCREIEIHGYRFVATATYRDDVKRLAHSVSCVSSDVRWDRTTGSNVVTAVVEISENEDNAVLAWADASLTAFSDVLLLLSLFTGREVVAVEEQHSENVFLRADSREFRWNAILACSIPYIAKQVSEDKEIEIGFAKTINEVYERIKLPEWRSQFGNGFYLFLAKVAFQQCTLEAAFIHSWTIWEHLFALQTQSWLSDESIRKLESAEKIAFLLTRFGILPSISSSDGSRIKDLVRVRNRLIHFGMLPERDKVHDDADLFVRLTEYLIARTLGLEPSNVLNTMGRLEEYLKMKSK